MASNRLPGGGVRYERMLVPLGWTTRERRQHMSSIREIGAGGAGGINRSITVPLACTRSASAASGLTAFGCLIDQALAPSWSVAAASQGLSLRRSG